MTRLFRHARRLRIDRAGVAAVEMALVGTFIMVPVTAFMVEIGQALVSQYRLSRGLHAGLMYAWAAPTVANATSIQTFAVNGYGTNGVQPTATATYSYYCIDPTVGTHGSTPAASATASCPSGQQIGTYVQLQLATTINTIFPLYKGSATWPLSVSGTVRIQ